MWYTHCVSANASSSDLLKVTQNDEKVCLQHHTAGVISNQAVPSMISHLRRAPLEKLFARGGVHSLMVTIRQGTY